jgi:hypothetical protein
MALTGAGGTASDDAINFNSGILETGAAPHPYIMDNVFEYGAYAGGLVARDAGGVAGIDGYVDRIFHLTRRHIVGLDSGSPESDVFGSVGDTYEDSNGVRYTKTSGNQTDTGWAAD